MYLADFRRVLHVPAQRAMCATNGSMFSKALLFATTLAIPVLGCKVCSATHYGDVSMIRNVRRMQPDVLDSYSMPRRPLRWGELNFLHTTDTHGWLEGHLKEQNYGADWGDFASFTTRMKQKADQYGVDLLLIDTGDLHDGNGLSDGTSPNGYLSNPIFEKIDYDLMTIGNHELYVSAIAYETFNKLAKVYGERYLTTNVEIYNPSTKVFEYIGHRYREFTTPKGVKILSFGVLYDFTRNSNVSRVTFAADLIQEQWFKDQIMTTNADIIVLLGHNPPRPGVGSTFSTIISAIRSMRPDKPIQVFGGHTHLRDFVVYDEKATGLESGRFCETLGWLSINGLRDDTINTSIPDDVPQATRSAITRKLEPTIAPDVDVKKSEASNPLYSRRYIDWNRLSFEYHATGSQSDTFDTKDGLSISSEIYAVRKRLQLDRLIGCAPQSWCFSCKPFGDPDNIFTVLSKALASQVVNESRSDIPRYIILHTGSVRFDLIQGPFTLNDQYIVNPFTNTFKYLPKVPLAQAQKVIGYLNSGGSSKHSGAASGGPTIDICLRAASVVFSDDSENLGRLTRRQTTSILTPGYTTTDDFGSNGDDTNHSTIPHFPQPEYFQANASFPSGTPKAVDVVFLDFIAPNVLAALNTAGGSYEVSQVMDYLPSSYTAQDYLPGYAAAEPAWQENVPNCPINSDLP